jgi:hypothetical protein
MPQTKKRQWMHQQQFTHKNWLSKYRATSSAAYPSAYYFEQLLEATLAPVVQSKTDSLFQLLFVFAAI